MKNILIFLLSLTLFVGGIYLIGEAWSIPQWEGVVFFGGILGVTLSFFIPFVVVPRLDP